MVELMFVTQWVGGESSCFLDPGFQLVAHDLGQAFGAIRLHIVETWAHVRFGKAMHVAIFPLTLACSHNNVCRRQFLAAPLHFAAFRSHLRCCIAHAGQKN